MARCKRELHPAVFNLHKHALRASVSAFPQMQITVTYACTFNLYKNLIALWLWDVDILDFKRLVGFYYILTFIWFWDFYIFNFKSIVCFYYPYSLYIF